MDPDPDLKHRFICSVEIAVKPCRYFARKYFTINFSDLQFHPGTEGGINLKKPSGLFPPYCGSFQDCEILEDK